MRIDKRFIKIHRRVNYQAKCFEFRFEYQYFEYEGAGAPWTKTYSSDVISVSFEEWFDTSFRCTPGKEPSYTKPYQRWFGNKWSQFKVHYSRFFDRLSDIKPPQ